MFPAGVSDQNPRLHLVLGQVGAAREGNFGLSQPRKEASTGFFLIKVQPTVANNMSRYYDKKLSSQN